MWGIAVNVAENRTGEMSSNSCEGSLYSLCFNVNTLSVHIDLFFYPTIVKYQNNWCFLAL